MEFKVIKKKDVKISKWSGGTTKEIFIFPEDAIYSSRKFDFRISSATVDNEKSEFTKLIGYNRILMILDGKINIVHNENPPIELKKYEKNCFLGSWNTISYGKCIDFNLMFSSKYLGEIDHHFIEGKMNFIIKSDGKSSISKLIYVHRGSVEIVLEEKKVNLSEGDSIFLKKINPNMKCGFILANVDSDIIINSLFLKS